MFRIALGAGNVPGALGHGDIEARRDYYRASRAAYDRTHAAIARSMSIGP